ncbi:MAG: AAA family ATPase, partial [Candidatus Paceibacterota bacterium]
MNPHTRERERTKHTQVLDSKRLSTKLETREPRTTEMHTTDIAPGFESRKQSVPSANALSAAIPSKLAQYLFLQMQALKSARAVGEMTHAPITRDTHKTQRLELDKIMREKPTNLCSDQNYAIALAAPILQKGVRRSGLMQTIRECPEKNITEHYFGFKSNVLRRWKREHPTDRLSVTIKYADGRNVLGTVKIQTITEPECFYFDQGSVYDSVLHYHPLNWSVQELQLRGSCSTRQTYTRTDLTDGWTVMNIKSSANQCLTACFRSFMLEQRDDPKYEQATKHCNSIEKLARCPHACQKDTPRDESDIRALCLFFEIYARVFIHGRKKAIITIGDIHHTVLDLLREGVDGADMHYLRITQGTPIHTTQTIDFIAREHKEKKANAELNDTERARLYAEQMESRTWTDTKQSFDELVTRIVSTKSNVLIEGGAGVGKSTLARRVCELLRANHVTVHMCATTGIAACAYVGGMTIDRFIMIHKTSSDSLTDNVLFIDEISMMSGYHFDKVATFCQSHKMRMIAIGDICQLPPVAQKEEGYFMQAERFVTMNFQKVRLDVVRRTDNQEFALMCKSFRTTDTHDAHYSPIPLDWFDARYVADANPDEYDIYLASRNATVDEYNARTLDTFEEHYEYEVREHSSDEVREHSSDDKKPFRCAVGARVMVTRNHIIHNRLIANGMTGTVVECYDEYINVLIDGDEEVTPIAYISSNYIYDRQDKHNSHERPYKFIPLKLAFAMTIHKSQGSTIRGRVLVNWDNLFGSSMLYVALTRVTDPDNITFT